MNHIGFTNYFLINAIFLPSTQKFALTRFSQKFRESNLLEMIHFSGDIYEKRVPNIYCPFTLTYFYSFFPPKASLEVDLF